MFLSRSALQVAACLTLAAAAPAFAQLPPPPADNAITASPPSAVSGRITRFLINPNGDVDGVVLDDSTQVNLAPHLSGGLLQIARSGDRITVQGTRADSDAAIRASSITNVTSGQSLVDQPPMPGAAPPAPLAALTPLSSNARVERLLYGDRGEVNGALLDDKSIVRFPPQVGLQLQSTLKPGAQLAATGYGTRNAYGTAFEATSLSVDGQAPVPVFPPPPPRGPAPLDAPGRS